jgi:hypothetical protein
MGVLAQIGTRFMNQAIRKLAAHFLTFPFSNFKLSRRSLHYKRLFNGQP